jgi:hypothetical protein
MTKPLACAGVVAVPAPSATDDAAVPLGKKGAAAAGAAPAAARSKVALKTWVHSLFQARERHINAGAHS